MTTTTIDHRPRPTIASSLGASLRRVRGAVSLWRARARERTQLGELPPELLRDIGITVEQARDESGKPFWRV